MKTRSVGQLIAAFLGMLLFPIVAVAQPPRNFFPWWDSPVARDLNLSPDQQKQIRETVREYRSKLIDLRSSVEKAEADLEDQFNDEAIDNRKAGEAIDRLAGARADLTRAFSQMTLRLRSVLTPDQWRELQRRNPRMNRPGPDGGAPRIPGQGPMNMRRQPMPAQQPPQPQQPQR